MEPPSTSTTSRSARRPTSRTAASPSRIPPARRSGRATSGRPAADPRLLRAAGRLPHLVDGVDHAEQVACRGGVHRLLHLRGRLRRLPEGVVEVRVLLEVLRLEVVVPQHVEVELHELGALLLDVDASGAEELVIAGVMLLDDPQAGLRLDACL